LISGIVLAAGTSSRLGRPKQLLELDGRPLLQHVIDALVAAELDEVVVVLGHEADAIRGALVLAPAVRTVFNPRYSSGQASSLTAGLDAVDPLAEAAVVVLGDQPRISPDLIRAAVAEWRTADAPVLRTYFGEVPGHPVVAARSAWPVLRDASGDEGARRVEDPAFVQAARLQAGAEPIADVDTVEDYERLRSE
jgi:molybdenum cofactor cytidylyltransferase